MTEKKKILCFVIFVTPSIYTLIKDARPTGKTLQCEKDR